MFHEVIPHLKILTLTLFFHSFELELRRSRGPDKEFIQKLDSVSYQLSSLDQDLQVRTQQPLPHNKVAMETAKKQQAVSNSIFFQYHCRGLQQL